MKLFYTYNFIKSWLIMTVVVKYFFLIRFKRCCFKIFFIIIVLSVTFRF
jgi:hypothetical protein